MSAEQEVMPSDNGESAPEAQVKKSKGRLPRKKIATSENDAWYEMLMSRFEPLEESTKSKLDALAVEKGYTGGFRGMARLFWEQKIFPYFAKAYYGPQEGFENLLQRLRGWVKSLGHHDSVVPDAHPNNEMALLVLKDFASVLEQADLSPEQANAALMDFCNIKIGDSHDRSTTAETGRS